MCDLTSLPYLSLCCTYSNDCFVIFDEVVAPLISCYSTGDEVVLCPAAFFAVLGSKDGLAVHGAVSTDAYTTSFLLVEWPRRT